MINTLGVFRVILIGIMFGFCFWLQTHTIISGDITWLMQVGKRLLAGGHYYTDFFEVNPPMCIYIYLLPVIASQYLHVSFITTVTFYIFIILSISWLACHYLLKKILPRSANIMRYTFECALAFTYLILPAYAFGQREYLLVVLQMPYLLLIALRHQQQNIKTWQAITIGIFAAIGFAQKPFFLPAWFFLELYLLLKTKNLTTWLFRPEIITCFFVFMAYGLSILLFTPEYITQILPFITSIYYLNFQIPLVLLFTQTLVIFSTFLLLFYCFLRKQVTYGFLTDLLAINTVCMLFIYLIQRTPWYYHILPTVMLGSLLLMLIIADFSQKNNLFKLKQLNWTLIKVNFIFIFLISLCFFPIITVRYFTTISFTGANKFFTNPIYLLAKKAAGQSIYIFTDNIAINYPLIDYSGTHPTSRFPCLWLLTAAQKLAGPEQNATQHALAHKIIDFVITADSNAIIKNKPAFIFIELSQQLWLMPKKNFIQHTTLALTRRPTQAYLKLFLQNQRFAKFWTHYRYIGTQNYYAIYEIKK